MDSLTGLDDGSFQVFEILGPRGARQNCAQATTGRGIIEILARCETQHGLHLLMAASAPVKFKNMLENVQSGRIAPVQIIALRN